MINILFTGVGRRVELLQAFLEASLVLEKDLQLYGADMNGTAPALSYCNHTRRVVGMNDPKYIDNLINICISDKIDLLIPTIDTDLLILSENKERFAAIGTRVMISESDKIKICRDKNNTSQFFKECGLCAPIPINDYKEYNSGFPAFIKPKDGSSSINAYKVENADQLKVYADQVKDYIIQPFVDGREYTVDIFCDWEGNPVSIVPRERLQVRAGEVLKTQIFMDEQIIEESRRICEKFHPCGPLTVQLIRDKEGVDWFIEINPRYGGGAPLSMKAGAKSAEAVLRLLNGQPAGEYAITNNEIYSRFDQSVCITQNIGAVKGVIFDLDDTLYSEKEYVRSGYKAVSDYLGGSYEKKLWNYFTEGKPAIDELLKEIHRENEKDIVLKVYRKHMPDIHLYNGVSDMIDKLRTRGIKVGIITDGRPEGQRNKIEALKLIVDDIIITDELGGTQFRKPCDIAFRIIQRRWGLSSHEIVYVGDNSVKDFQAPQQLGMKNLWFYNKEGLYSDAEMPAVPQIADITEVIEYVGVD